MDSSATSNLPVSTTLSTSVPTCSRKGDPPFTVTITYRSLLDRPIWAFVYQYSYQCAGIETRDPERNNRRIGPDSTSLADEPDPTWTYFKDSELVRLEPGEVYERQYTYIVVKKAKGLRNSDVWNLKVGNTYGITLRNQKWWWMFEDDMPEGCTEEERETLLQKQPVTEWKPDCSVSFEFVE